MSGKPNVFDYAWYASKIVGEKVFQVATDSATVIASNLGATITKNAKGVSITLPKNDSG